MVMEPSPAFGDLLRRYRSMAELTQEDLAERAGLSARVISEIERGGPHVPRRDTVALLAEALGLSAAKRQSFVAGAPRQRRGVPAHTRAHLCLPGHAAARVALCVRRLCPCR
jgi:transcriptional regulator with XRE-family HTH domain